MPTPESRREDWKIEKIENMAIGELPKLDRPPGMFVRDIILPEYGMNVSKLARHLDLNRAHLSNVFNGKSDMTRELAYRLAAAFRDELADFLIAYQTAWEVQRDGNLRKKIASEVKRLEPVEAE
ncbi:hypothetical protein AAG604_10610 [Citromicrobium bathyomarinum]|mgnify:CR=1 FL=1